MKYTACIFDLDGTIINTIHSLTYTTNLVMHQCGLDTVLTEEQMKHIVGDGYRKQLERSLIACGDKELTHYEEALRIYPEVFQQNCLYELEPYDGMLEMLHVMKQAGMKLAVLTNKPHTRALDNIKAVYGEHFFDYILGEQEGIPKKPDPTGVFHILKKLDIQPEQCLYMGDTNTDMRTANAAGLDAVGAIWGFRTREELESFSPKYLAERPLDVLEMIGLREDKQK
ncbi:MAG: HAD family hydrolase [Clostridiales bacterium]|nr:HAD family hydrolase [Clostridiales bacterium]